MAQEKPGQTLQATALVHDAYLRLVGGDEAQQWNSRGHFFAAAAEAMRRILVENARRKQRIRHGGQLQRGRPRQPASDIPRPPTICSHWMRRSERLAAEEPQAAEVVKLRYFAGLTIAETALALDISVRTAESTLGLRPRLAVAAIGLRPALVARRNFSIFCGTVRPLRRTVY